MPASSNVCVSKKLRLLCNSGVKMQRAHSTAVIKQKCNGFLIRSVGFAVFGRQITQCRCGTLSQIDQMIWVVDKWQLLLAQINRSSVKSNY